MIKQYYPLNYIIHPDDSGIYRSINNYIHSGTFQITVSQNVSDISGMAQVNTSTWAPLKMAGTHIFPAYFLAVFNNPFITNLIYFLVLCLFVFVYVQKKTKNHITAMITGVFIFSIPPLLFWSSSFFSHFGAMFFMFVSYFYFDKYWTNRTKGNLFLFILFIGISIIYRYEFIFFYLIIFIYYLIKAKVVVLEILKQYKIIVLVMLLVIFTIGTYNFLAYNSPFTTGYNVEDNNLSSKQHIEQISPVNKIFNIITYFTDRLFEINIPATVRNITQFIIKVLSPIQSVFLIIALGLIIKKKEKMLESRMFILLLSLSVFIFYGTSAYYYTYGKRLLSSYVRYFLPIYLFIAITFLPCLITRIYLSKRYIKLFLIITILLCSFLSVNSTLSQGLKEADKWETQFYKVKDYDLIKNIIISDTINKAFVKATTISPANHELEINSILSSCFTNASQIYIFEQDSHKLYSNYVDNINLTKFKLNRIKNYYLVYEVTINENITNS
ncbi:hypothetical protein JXM83_02635 [Candidatus Woesearchaeota archaeon]|nr:hypothetical protein [Candidatus Woesearchaeota archaeon]